jgi:hypothetical protein
MPKEYEKTWEQIVKRRRIPEGFVSVLPVDFVLLTYLKRFNQTRALYNSRVDKEIESIMQYEDKQFIGECKEKWIKKKKTRASVVQAEEKAKHQMIQKITEKVEQKNILDISKKVNDVIVAKNCEQIPLQEAKECIQQIAKDKKEHDDALNSLLDSFFPTSQKEQKPKETKEKKNSPKKNTDIIECISEPNVKKSQGYYVVDNTVYKCNGEYYDIIMPKEATCEVHKKEVKTETKVGANLKKVMGKPKYLKNNEYIEKNKMEKKKSKQKEMLWHQFKVQQEIIDERHRHKDEYLHQKKREEDW